MVSKTNGVGWDARSKHQRGTTMNYYVGIDVSLEASSLCVVDANGKVVREGKVASEPDALIAWLRELKLELTRIGLEAGPLSQWLYAAMRQAGLAVELLETRAHRARDDAGEERPQRRARDRAADAVGLVPPGALQVDGCAGDARAAHRAQTAADKASGSRVELAGHSARL